MYKASAAFLDALQASGVSYIFANFGSDHPALIESLAGAKASGKPLPQVITCPSEMAALSAAHGFAQITGRAQAVFVHVECGTQSLAGAIHNAAKGRIPVLIFAGTSPYTQEGELPGSRNEFIHWLQDVFDQRGIVRGYVKYDNEIRSGKNIQQLVYRAMQFAHSDPKGPVYLMGSREVLEEDALPSEFDAAHWPPIAPAAILDSDAAALVEELAGARRPIVITSYLGREPRAVEELVRFCHRLGVGVLESVPSCVNYPVDDPLYQGYQGNEPEQNPLLAEADAILVLDCDVPWMPTVNRPPKEARIYHIDVDPLKEQMPLWYIATQRTYRADAFSALRQMNACLDRRPADPRAVEARIAWYTARHAELRSESAAREEPRGDVITPQFLTARLRQHLDADTIVLNEGITNYKAIMEHIGERPPGGLFTSGGGSLGWNGGAAIGMKLACPDKTVVALTGDGTFLFSAPSSVHWMARRYRTPFLQIVYNNGGWRAPKLSTLSVHPDGYASKNADIDVSFDCPPDYSAIAAAAGGAFARIVRHPAELDEALAQGFHAVRNESRCAVLDVQLPRL